VSALNLPLDKALFETYTQLVIGVDDVDDEDILQHFPESNAFIEQGLKEGGGVLVHWWVITLLERSCHRHLLALEFSRKYRPSLLTHWRQRYGQVPLRDTRTRLPDPPVALDNHCILSLVPAPPVTANLRTQPRVHGPARALPQHGRS